VSKKDQREKADCSRPADTPCGIGNGIPYLQVRDEESLDPSPVRHFTAGNPHYMSLRRGFGRFAPPVRVPEETNPKLIFDRLLELR
jgi:hypothetical protein